MTRKFVPVPVSATVVAVGRRDRGAWSRGSSVLLGDVVVHRVVEVADEGRGPAEERARSSAEQDDEGPPDAPPVASLGRSVRVWSSPHALGQRLHAV